MDELEFKKNFGRRLCMLRRSRKLTQEKLSELVGLDPQYYCKMENGNHFPSVKTIVKILDLFQLEPKELFNFTNSANAIIDEINTSLTRLNRKELHIVSNFVDSIIALN